MFRAIWFFGSSLALKSVFSRMAGFALYTSPNALPAAGCAFTATASGLFPVPPRPVATSTSVAASSTSTGSSRRMRLTSGPFRTCILSPFPVSVPAFLDPSAVACRRLWWSQHTAQERRDSVAGDEHPDDDRSAEDDELHRRRQAEDAQHLRQERQRERCHPGRRCARQPARKRRAGNDDCGERRQEVRGAEARV